MSDFKFTASDKFKKCFVCSPHNPYGLQLVNSFVDGRSHMELTPHKNMEGLNGYMHGGFALMLLDEIMVYAVEGLQIDSLTLHSECDFKNPAHIGRKLIAEGWVEKQDGRKIYTSGELRDAETGTIIASGKGLYYQMDMKSFLDM